MPYCAVPACCVKVGGHQFPKDPSVLQKWLVAIRRENFTPSEFVIVCRNHFTSEDYEKPIFSILDKPRLKLRPDAVPSKFPWNDPTINFKNTPSELKYIIENLQSYDIRKKKRILKYGSKNTTQNKKRKGFTKIKYIALTSRQALELPKSTESISSQSRIVIQNPNPNIQGNVIRKLIPIKASDIKSKSLKLIPINSPDIQILNLNTLSNKSQNSVDISTIKNENRNEYFISPKNVLVANKACQVNLNPNFKSIETTFTCNRYIYSDHCEAGIQIEIAPKLIPIKVSDIQNKCIGGNNKQLSVSKINETTVNPEFVSVSTIKTEPGLISDQCFDVPIMKSKKITIKEELRIRSEELRIKSEELRIKSEELRIKSEQLSEDEVMDNVEFNEDPLIKEEPMDEMSDT